MARALPAGLIRFAVPFGGATRGEIGLPGENRWAPVGPGGKGHGRVVGSSVTGWVFQMPGEGELGTGAALRRWRVKTEPRVFIFSMELDKKLDPGFLGQGEKGAHLTNGQLFILD